MKATIRHYQVYNFDRQTGNRVAKIKINTA